MSKIYDDGGNGLIGAGKKSQSLNPPITFSVDKIIFTSVESLHSVSTGRSARKKSKAISIMRGTGNLTWPIDDTVI